MPLVLMFGGSALLAIPGFERRDWSYREGLTKVLWFRDLGRIRRRLCLCAILDSVMEVKRVPAGLLRVKEMDDQKGKFMDFLRKEVRAFIFPA